MLKTFASKSYRNIMVASTHYSDDEFARLKAENNKFQEESDKEVVESGLNILAIFGLQDPLRPGIKDAVAQCHKSGINVRMVTGDNIDTAIAISKDACIIP